MALGIAVTRPRALSALTSHANPRQARKHGTYAHGRTHAHARTQKNININIGTCVLMYACMCLRKSTQPGRGPRSRRRFAAPGEAGRPPNKASLEPRQMPRACHFFPSAHFRAIRLISNVSNPSQTSAKNTIRIHTQALSCVSPASPSPAFSLSQPNRGT